jgi:prevent-host-death family protein
MIAATEAKAKFLALIDEVAEQGGAVTVTKRGKPLVTIAPAEARPWKSLKGILRGKVDPSLCENVDLTDLWDCVKPERAFLD